MVYQSSWPANYSAFHPLGGTLIRPPATFSHPMGEGSIFVDAFTRGGARCLRTANTRLPRAIIGQPFRLSKRCNQASAWWRKQLTRWSLTIPTACMLA